MNLTAKSKLLNREQISVQKFEYALIASTDIEKTKKFQLKAENNALFYGLFEQSNLKFTQASKTTLGFDTHILDVNET